MMLPFVIASAQNEGGDKEVIIIEKIVDQDGNVISKQSKRFNGKYSEDEIQELIDEESAPSIRSFDLEGLGFAEEGFDFFQPRSKRPTIGVNLDFEEGLAKVSKVMSRSGAETADIRVGDQLLSISGVAISSIDDIHEILDTKKPNDKVRLIIFRDGEELEKEIELSGNNGSSFFFDLPEGGAMRFFGNGSDNLSFDIDSLFSQMMDMDGFSESFGMPFSLSEDSKASQKPASDNRASLGIFIDDIGAGVLVSEVIPDSPAERVGIRKGDVIIEVDNMEISQFSDLTDLMATKNIGDKLVLKIERDGEIKTLEASLE